MSLRFRAPSRALRRVAALTLSLASLAGVAGTQVGTASAASLPPAGRAIQFAVLHLGDTYVYGGNGPSVFDCSGLTQQAYRSAGISLPRTAADQYYAGAKLPLSQLQPGDLLFWATNTRYPSTIHHVAIAVSKWTMIAAPHTGTVVQVQPIYTSGLMPYVVRPGGVNAPRILTPWPAPGGSSIYVIQERLRANGIYVPYSGWYDSRTRSAVVTFQHRYGIAYDNSTVQWRTWSALFAHGQRYKMS